MPAGKNEPEVWSCGREQRGNRCMRGVRGYMVQGGRIHKLQKRYLTLEFKDRAGLIMKVLLDYFDEVLVAFYEL
jgi:hypothetical protein